VGLDWYLLLLGGAMGSQMTPFQYSASLVASYPEILAESFLAALVEPCLAFQVG
jgi:hypothetical protein